MNKFSTRGMFFMVGVLHYLLGATAKIPNGTRQQVLLKYESSKHRQKKIKLLDIYHSANK